MNLDMRGDLSIACLKFTWWNYMRCTQFSPEVYIYLEYWEPNLTQWFPSIMCQLHFLVRSHPVRQGDADDIHPTPFAPPLPPFYLDASAAPLTRYKRALERQNACKIISQCRTGELARSPSSVLLSLSIFVGQLMWNVKRFYFVLAQMLRHAIVESCASA